MADDVPKIVIDVDVTGTEKIEKVAEATKKVDAAQKEAEKRQKQLAKSFDMVGRTAGRVNAGLGGMLGLFGKLAFAATPLFSALSIAGMGISAFSEAMEKNQKAIEEQRERFEREISVASTARAEFAELTKIIAENGEVMEKYGIKFSGTIASMTASIAGLKSARVAANIAANEDKLMIDARAEALGGYDKVEERDRKTMEANNRKLAFAQSTSALSEKYGPGYAPDGFKAPIFSGIVDGIEQFFSGMNEDELKMRHVFRQAGFKEGETGEEYKNRLVAENEEKIARIDATMRKHPKGTEFLSPEMAQAQKADAQNILNMVKYGVSAGNNDPKNSAIATVLLMLSREQKNLKTGEEEQLDETKKKIEDAKKVESALKPKSTGKQPPPGVWDTNTMGAIKYSDLTANNAKNAPIINIANTIDVSGLDPNNAEEMANEIARRIGNSLLPYVNSGGGMF